MGWAWIGLGAALLWMGWDAFGTIKTKRLSSREIAERVYGAGAPELPEHLELRARTRWLIQGSSLASLIGLVFCACGLACIVGGIALILE